MSRFGRLAHREPVIILTLTALGACLRFRRFGEIGLTHFDEGIYALAGLWSVAPRGLGDLDPELIAYSPPGFPMLIGLAYLAFGISDSSAVLSSLLCGVATIPVVGWLGRRTFGPGAGAASSGFAALSIADIAFSRKALTDSPFLLGWLIAIGLGQRFLESPRLGRGLALGVAVGVAQNFKYNGWLAGALVALTAALGAIARRDERAKVAIARTLGYGVLAASVAVLVYAPWFGFVESHGGYPSLLRHQRAYLGGFSAWYPHWKQQLAQVVALSGGPYWGIATWFVSWVGCAFAANRTRLVQPGIRWGAARFRIGLLGGATLLAGMSDFPWWAGLATVPWLIFDARHAPRLIGASWLLLSILTPFYHPYARLWLPLHSTGWLILGGLISEVLRSGSENQALSPDGPGEGRQSIRRVRFRAIALVACVSLGLMRGGEKPHPLPFDSYFRSTSRFREFTDVLDTSSAVPTNPRIGLRVVARRSLVFYLAVQRKFPVRIESNSDFLLARSPSGDWALIDEVILNGDPASWSITRDLRRNRFPRHGWTFVKDSGCEIDPITLLDVAPDEVFREWALYPRAPEAMLWLLKPSRH